MVQLVILGFLKERDYHGYELKKEIQKRMEHWTDIKFGSIYHALKVLVEKGSVEKVKTLRQSSRPDRTIYRITEQGKEDFCKRLKDQLSKIQKVYLAFNVGIYFAENLPQSELQAILDERIEEHEEMLMFLENTLNMTKMAKMNKIKEVILTNSIYHVGAELKWLKEIRELEDKGHLFHQAYKTDTV